MSSKRALLLVAAFVFFSWLLVSTGSSTPLQVQSTAVSTSHVAHAVAHPKPETVHWYSPIFNLGGRARVFFTCVLSRESHSTWNHPNTHDGDPAYPGQYGIFQFNWPTQNNAWDAYIYPVLHVEPRYASAFQQAKGAAILWKLGVGEVENTWTQSDGCQP